MARTKHKGNGHDPREVTETPDVSHIKNPDVTHEISDVSVSGVGKFVGGLTVLTVVVFFLMWGLFRLFNTQETEREPDPGPMAMSAKERLPPPPRLQAARGFEVQLENGEVVNLQNAAPEAEYHVLRDQWERRLNCKDDASLTKNEDEHANAPVSGAAEPRKAGCVSIEDAIQKLVQSSPPSKVQTISEEGPGWRAADYGIDAPTAASSGRLSDRGKR
jgi:hypothetical protein